MTIVRYQSSSSCFRAQPNIWRRPHRLRPHRVRPGSVLRDDFRHPHFHIKSILSPRSRSDSVGRGLYVGRDLQRYSPSCLSETLASTNDPRIGNSSNVNDCDDCEYFMCGCDGKCLNLTVIDNTTVETPAPSSLETITPSRPSDALWAVKLPFFT